MSKLPLFDTYYAFERKYWLLILVDQKQQSLDLKCLQHNLGPGQFVASFYYLLWCRSSCLVLVLAKNALFAAADDADYLSAI